jgi:hypothetical protein
VFHDDPIPVDIAPRHRKAARIQWFEKVQNSLATCNLVFVDPDNGLEPSSFRLQRRKAGKSITLAELQALRAPGRSLIAYHHQTRWRGGHRAEINHRLDQLQRCGFIDTIALRANAFSPRVFFILDPGTRTPSAHIEVSEDLGWKT